MWFTLTLVSPLGYNDEVVGDIPIREVDGRENVERVVISGGLMGWVGGVTSKIVVGSRRASGMRSRSRVGGAVDSSM